MGSRVYHGPESHGVCDLSVEPNVLVCGEEPCQARADDTDNIPEHGHEDESAIERKDKTCTTRRPHGPLQAVQRTELRVRFLRVQCLPTTKKRRE